MPYTMADFRRDLAKEMLKDMTPQERMKGLTTEQILATLPVTEIERYLACLKNGGAPKKDDSIPQQ
jgi:hypothetical protein